MVENPDVYSGMLYGMLHNEIKCLELGYTDEVNARLQYNHLWHASPSENNTDTFL